MSEKFPKPAGLTDESLFKARTTGLEFINPRGSHEHYARVHSFARSHDDQKFWPDDGARDRGVSVGSSEREDREKRFGTQSKEMAKVGRPLK